MPAGGDAAGNSSVRGEGAGNGEAAWLLRKIRKATWVARANPPVIQRRRAMIHASHARMARASETPHARKSTEGRPVYSAASKASRTGPATAQIRMSGRLTCEKGLMT